MSASERDVPQQPRVAPGHGDMSGISASGLSMSDLLASCAAASAISTPPVEQGEGRGEEAGEERRDAA
ncbi:hypothetical protein OG698_20775 [Streptomyces sp. NBC_01003]|uniref:hypothetical protein n=1 Tax=unclassified Streptomyces TaxID=2593676 RepID=UPI000C27D06F|nr:MULTISPECIES: hypothetical protein [unclassified Streptomyces]PJN10023.1 hypothetical protein CG723_20105 [Streptomyces sp. CB01635]WSW25452.1 hypothetical protein OG698_20775 [Streptomyces sp. NBC_01003]